MDTIKRLNRLHKTMVATQGEDSEYAEDVKATILEIEQLQAENAMLKAERWAITQEDREIMSENVLMRDALKTVVDYYSKQGTGKVFHLGYGGDSAKEIKLHGAINSTPQTDKIQAVLDAAIKMGTFLLEAWGDNAERYISAPTKGGEELIKAVRELGGAK